jgi:hypothetical protein
MSEIYSPSYKPKRADFFLCRIINFQCSSLKVILSYFLNLFKFLPDLQILIIYSLFIIFFWEINVFPTKYLFVYRLLILIQIKSGYFWNYNLLWNNLKVMSFFSEKHVISYGVQLISAGQLMKEMKCVDTCHVIIKRQI